MQPICGTAQTNKVALTVFFVVLNRALAMGILPPAKAPMQAVMKNMKQAQCAEPAKVLQEAVKEPASERLRAQKEYLHKSAPC